MLTLIMLIHLYVAAFVTVPVQLKGDSFTTVEESFHSFQR